MADRRKRSPAVRFLKRNGLYIMIIAALLLMIAAAITIVTQVKKLSPAKQEEPAQTVSEPAAQPAQDTKTEETPGDTTEEQTPADESVYTPPFAGKTVLLADGKLVMTFDEEALTMQESGGLGSLTDADGAQVSRLDVQKLDIDMSLFKQSELERICIGAVQAYYYLAPETKDFTVSNAVKEDDHFEAAIDAPAYDTEAAVAARVALWKIDGACWCVSAICPEGEDGAAIFAAFSSIEPLGEKLLAEAQP